MHIVQPGMEIDVLKENNKIAHENYRLMKQNGIKSIDFMGSIGAGKTALIIKLAEKLRAKGIRACAIAGDVTGDDDYTRFEKSGLHSVNCNTGHECHLDANLIKKTLSEIDLTDYDVIFVENVGNLVCPADFPLGTDLRVVVVSVTEGDDMVRKHHDIFIHSDIAILNKVDIADAVDVDPDVIARDYNKLTGGVKNIYKCSVKKEQGLDEILAALKLRGVRMKVLTVGGGGREHAAVQAFHRSGSELYCVMKNANPGIIACSKDYLLCDEKNTERIVSYAKEKGVELAFIGPEAPLEVGLADALESAGIKCASPTKAAARIETSKSFMRNLVEKHGIDGNLSYASFDNPEDAERYLTEIDYEIVVKPIGLTGGKGVKVQGEHLHSFDDIMQYVREIFEENIGGAGVILEERAVGEEFTQMVFVDGKHVVPMPLVQDHKRAYEGDVGPNTGGMGSYTDGDHLLPFVSAEDREHALDIVQSIVDALASEGCPYRGVMYGQFMLTANGPKIIEINARFGDPEAMNVLTVLESNFEDICLRMAEGRLEDDVRFSRNATVCKYVVPRGYGVKSESGHPISVDTDAIEECGAVAYYANVDVKDGKLVTGTSRSVGVVGKGMTIEDAEKNCEAALNHVKCDAMFVRHDIGTRKLVQRRVDHMNSLRT